MTADAKVGLLLGLFFIIVIAFLINGLPKFLQAASAEEPFDTQIESPPAPDLVIDNRVVETARNLEQDVPLRRTAPPEQVVVLSDPSPDEQTDSTRIRAEQIASVSVRMPSIPVESPAPPVGSAPPRYHVVQRGENLPVIAKQYYGPEEGNRRIVIQKLYEANRDVLESPSKIRVDDKLVIPPLEELLNESPRTPSAAAAPTEESSFLSRFANFFEPVDSDKPAKRYVVQQGESLWSIAQKTLGDGKRYREILAANEDIEDPDQVRAGMSLTIPQ